MSENVGKSEPVQSLADYKPADKTYRVSLTFSGDASKDIGELLTRLHSDDVNDVVKRAIALLVSAKDRDIVLRDPKTGMTQAVEI